MNLKLNLNLAVEIIQELKQWEFRIKLVLADSLYGESGHIIDILDRCHLSYIVAIRSHHGVGMSKGQRIRYNRWRAYQQKFNKKQPEKR